MDCLHLHSIIVSWDGRAYHVEKWHPKRCAAKREEIPFEQWLGDKVKVHRFA